MTLQLDATQAAVLRSVIEVRLGGLSTEIRHTDTPRVRQELRAEREVLRDLLAQVQPDAA